MELAIIIDYSADYSLCMFNYELLNALCFVGSLCNPGV